MWTVGTDFNMCCNKIPFWWKGFSISNDSDGSLSNLKTLKPCPLLSNHLPSTATLPGSLVAKFLQIHPEKFPFESFSDVKEYCNFFFSSSLSQTGLQRHGVLGLVHHRRPSWPVRYTHSQAGGSKSRGDFKQEVECLVWQDPVWLIIKWQLSCNTM